MRYESGSETYIFNLGAEWTRWSTPYILVDFNVGFYLEFKLGPFYLGIGWWDYE